MRTQSNRSCRNDDSWRRVRVFVIEVTHIDGNRKFVKATLDEREAKGWRDDFNRISGDSRIRAFVYPISSAIRIAKARSRSA